MKPRYRITIVPDNVQGAALDYVCTHWPISFFDDRVMIDPDGLFIHCIGYKTN
jgi:hypothetical protein